VIVLVLLLLIVVGAILAIVGLVGFGPLATERGRERAEERAGCGVLVLAAPAVVVVLVVLLGAMAGLRGEGHEDETGVGLDRDDRNDLDEPAAPAAPTVVAGPVDSDALGPIVQVTGGGGAVGGLRADTVLRVQVDDLSPFDRARAMQCVGTMCGNVVPVQLDGAGRATFEYLVTDRFVPAAEEGRCRLDATSCSLVVEAIDGDARASIQTLFVDQLPEPGSVAVQPSTGLAPRQEVAVRLSGFVPGAAIQLSVCAAPASSGLDRCSDVGDTVLGRTGGGTASVRVPATVGRDRVECVSTGCVLQVRSTSSFARAPASVLRYALPDPVDYDGRRLLAGVVVAALLLGLAAFFVLRTDWSPIGEAAAPEIDEAEYADLDALVEAMPPEDDDELVARSS
jgi:hypothetical protein